MARPPAKANPRGHLRACCAERAPRTRKGQLWSTDFVAALSILTFILLFSMVFWDNLAARWNSAEDYRQMQTDAFFAADALMTSPGDPPSWEMLPALDDNVSSIGLANGRNELNAVKLGRLAGANASTYDLVKRRLGVQRYGLHVGITDLDGDMLYYEFGTQPGPENSVVVLKRLGMLNNTPVSAEIKVWK